MVYLPSLWEEIDGPSQVGRVHGSLGSGSPWRTKAGPVRYRVLLVFLLPGGWLAPLA